MALQVMDPSDILKQEEEIISLQKSLQEEVALRKEDPRPAPTLLTMWKRFYTRDQDLAHRAG